MSRIYKRGNRWYIDCIDHRGERVRRSAGRTKAEAAQVLKEVTTGIEIVRQEVAAGEPPSQGITLRELAGPWLARRARKGLRTVSNDKGYLEHHLLPGLGDLPVKEIRVKHIRAFIEGLEAKGLAPRTVRHIYGSTRKLFSDLVVEEVIPSSPCVLTRDYLPSNVDADPGWRSRAVFTAEEVRTLLGSELPADRRTLYLLLFYTGIRLGEAIGLRWGDIDPTAEPLQKLIIQRSYERRTKTKVTRLIPIHPDLQEAIRVWRDTGAAQLLGHEPGEEDLILPSHRGGMRDNSSVLRRFHRDLRDAGLRPRRVHDARRTFVTLCRAGGARPDIIRAMTHTSSRDMIDLYTSLPWKTLCEAILCLPRTQTDP